MKEGHKFVPPHAAIIFQMPEKGHDFMRCYYAATSGLRFQGFMAFFVETHAAYNPQEIRPDLERPQWTIPMVHRNSSGDPLSARQLSKSSFKEITSAAATDLLCPVVLRHLVVPTKASGPYTNAIIVAGTHRLSLYTYWRWSSFQPYTRPLKRTKAFFYINGTLAPDVLEDLDLPRAFWSLGLLVFASIYNSGLPANDGTLHTHDNRHFAQIVFSIIDKVSEYRPIRPVWIISRDIIPFMYLAEISLLDDAAVTWLIERRLQTVGRVPDFLVQVYLKNGKLLTLEEMSMMSMVGPADVEKVVVRVLGNCRSMSERQAIFNWKPAAPGVRRV